jgi:hypothetical protein
MPALDMSIPAQRWLVSSIPLSRSNRDCKDSTVFVEDHPLLSAFGTTNAKVIMEHDHPEHLRKERSFSHALAIGATASTRLVGLRRSVASAMIHWDDLASEVAPDATAWNTAPVFAASNRIDG